MNQADQAHRQLTIITFALVGGMTLFAGVVAMLHTGGSMAPAWDGGTTLRLAAALVGVGLLAVGAMLTPRPGSAPGAPAGGHESPGSILNRTIAAQAVREGAGMLGGVVGLLTGDLLLMAALVAASAAAMIVALPSREEMRRRVGY